MCKSRIGVGAVSILVVDLVQLFDSTFARTCKTGIRYVRKITYGDASLKRMCQLIAEIYKERGNIYMFRSQVVQNDSSYLQPVQSHYIHSFEKRRKMSKMLNCVDCME